MSVYVLNKLHLENINLINIEHQRKKALMHKELTKYSCFGLQLNKVFKVCIITLHLME